MAQTLANAGSFNNGAALNTTYLDSQNTRGDAGGGVFEGYIDFTGITAALPGQAILATRVLPGGVLRTAAVGNTVTGASPTLPTSKVGPVISAEGVYFGISTTWAGTAIPWRHYTSGRLASLYQGTFTPGALNVETTVQTVAFGGSMTWAVDCGNIFTGAGNTVELRAYTRQGAGAGGTITMADRLVINSAAAGFAVQEIFFLGPNLFYDTVQFRLVQTAGTLASYDWRVFRSGF